MLFNRAALFGGILTSVVAFSSAAAAATFSFQGTFTQDDEVQLFNFDVAAASNVILRTFSYAGGTNGQGDPIARGGFDPILALFASDGTLIGTNDDGDSTQVPADSVTGQFYDTYFGALLQAGSYIVAVMQYDNFAAGTNLSDGFQQTGATFTSEFGCSQGFFCDFTGDNRDGHWAFDIENVESAVVVPPVPIPAALPLLATGLGALGVIGWRRKRKLAEA